MRSMPRYLMLVAGLLLAFPQGWCCAALRVLERASDSASAPACCCCCPAPVPVEDSQKQDQREEKGSPKRCCLVKQLLPPGPKPSSGGVDLAVVEAACPVAVQVHAIGLPEAIDPVFSNIPVHLLQCVWRC